jgi:hypothetical protein
MRRILPLACLSCLFLAAPAAPSVSADEPAGEPTVIEMFNGKDLSGWRGREDLWSVEDGVITGRTTADNPIKKNTFLIWSEGRPSDFELTCQFKIEGGNSGIQYRSKIIDEAAYVLGGYQADIDFSLKYAGINYEEQGRGILALRGQRVTLKPDGEKKVETFGDATEIGKVIKGGQWNRYRIVADGNRLQHFINDTLTSEVIDLNADKRSKSGVIGLQIHVGPPMTIQFKDLHLKLLK